MKEISWVLIFTCLCLISIGNSEENFETNGESDKVNERKLNLDNFFFFFLEIDCDEKGNC